MIERQDYVVTGGFERPWTDETGIETIGLIPFLLDPTSHLAHRP